MNSGLPDTFSPIANMPNFLLLLKKFAGTRIFTVFFLVAICLVGFYLRFDNLYTWLENKSLFFTSSGLPITLGTDPYYYLDIADDLLAGEIKTFDEMRNFPAGGSRPSAAPLLAVLLAATSFLTGQALEWVAVLIPPFLGVLLAIPVYFLVIALTMNAVIPGGQGRMVSSTEAKFTGGLAALFALLSPPLVVRSSIGWCDTDVLNVTFTVLCLLLAVRFYSANSRRTALKYFWAWFTSFLGFAWWWDTALGPVVFLGGGPMLLALLLLARDRFTKKQLYYAGPAFLLLLIFFAWQGEGLLKIQNLYSYVFGSEVSTVFPAFESLVDEQQNRDFMRIAASIGGNPYLYLGAIAGLALLFWLTGRKFLLLIPLLVVNILALQGMRFMIFAAPLLGLGLASLFLAIMLPLRRMKGFRFAVVLVLVLIAARPPVALSQSYNGGRPVLLPGVYDGMKAVAGSTPENSVIWSSWGHGHPLVYYAGRRTIADGMFHSVSLDYVSKFALAANNFRLAANWIQFYAAHGQPGLHTAFQTLTGDKQNWADGVPGLKKLFTIGVSGSRRILGDDYGLAPREAEKFLAFLFPLDSPPVYLFLDYKLFSEGWYNLGRWNLARKTGPANYTLIPLEFYTAGRFAVQGTSPSGMFSADLGNGIFRQGGQLKKLAQITIDDGEVVNRQSYQERGRFHFLYLSSNKDNGAMSGLVADYQVKNTVLVKLFYEKETNPFFVDQDLSQLPLYMFCRVNGEKYSPDQPS
jgi:asparagine N-glycosylation enzyme membrane subunit Stt3